MRWDTLTFDPFNIFEVRRQGRQTIHTYGALGCAAPAQKSKVSSDFPRINVSANQHGLLPTSNDRCRQRTDTLASGLGNLPCRDPCPLSLPRIEHAAKEEPTKVVAKQKEQATKRIIPNARKEPLGKHVSHDSQFHGTLPAKKTTTSAMLQQRRYLLHGSTHFNHFRCRCRLSATTTAPRTIYPNHVAT
jgi:hypothetical protein